MRNNEYDTKLVVYRSRKVTLLMFVLAAIIGFGMMIVQGLEQGLDWWHFVVPVCAIGSLFCLYPPTEQWEYKPWQGRPRKVEQNFNR